MKASVAVRTNPYCILDSVGTAISQRFHMMRLKKWFSILVCEWSRVITKLTFAIRLTQNVSNYFGVTLV